MLPLSAAAQVGGGLIRGEIRDVARAMIPEVHVVVRSVETSVEILAQTNGQGLYTTPTLKPGSYLVVASKTGFKTETFGPVLLEVNQSVRVDLELNVGATSESIQVDATTLQVLSTESTEISQVISNKQVAQLPLNGRRWQQLISLSAGVNPGSPGESGSPNPININGQRNKANLFLADGVSTTSSSQGRANGFNIPLEAVREFSVQAGAYSAEYGNVGGGVINLQTRSGTDKWHGSLFEFFRNDALDAANFFSNATGQARNPLRYNQFGGSIGGPVKHQRTFVFADYQGTLTRAGAPVIATVRPNEQRAGDFSNLLDARGALIPIYSPFDAALARTPLPGNRIPTAQLDPAAVKIAALLPQPNQYDSSGNPLPFNNFAATRKATGDAHAFDVRLDHQLSSKSNLYGRHSFQDNSGVTQSLFGLPLGGPPSLAGTSTGRNQNLAIGHTYQFGPSLMNEVRLGLNRQTSAILQGDYGRNLADEFGIPGVNRSPETSGLSTINVSGLFGVGGSILTPLRLASTNWNFSDKMTWLVGKHTVRFGLDYQWEMGSTGYLVFGRGMYTFLNLTTSTAQGTAGGDAFASFMAGAPFQVLRDAFPPGLVGLTAPRTGFYVQDDFRLHRKLTVNLGARYDVMPYPQERYNRLSNFDPATRTMLIAGKDISRRIRETDFGNLAPRVGLAYTPTARSVIRAGYGIGYIDPWGSASILNSNEFNIPFYFRDNITQFPFSPPRYLLSSRLPELAVPSPSAPTGDQRHLVPGDRNQYSQTWSLSLQHALTPNLVLETAYVGTSGVRLLMTSNLNAAPPGATDPVTRRPLGSALGEVRSFPNGAHSTYHGWQTKIEQRFSRGLYFLASYTWSKSIDNQSTGTDDAAASGQSPQNPRNFALDRGLSSFDRTHRFVASAVWQIPGSNALWSPLRRIAGGWQLSGTVEFQTGAPFSVLMPCATIGADGNNCRPNRRTSGELTEDQRSITAWFDKTAFVTPNPRAYGNSGRNILRGPGSANTDLMLAKAIRWGAGENQRIQLRGEFFNAFNHTNLGLPVHSTDSPAIGSITSAGAARTVQLGLRWEF
ncbi:MAG: TonB-dependent receptor [Acidobacteriota bacterium]